LYSLISQF